MSLWLALNFETFLDMNLLKNAQDKIEDGRIIAKRSKLPERASLQIWIEKRISFDHKRTKWC